MAEPAVAEPVAPTAQDDGVAGMCVRSGGLFDGSCG
jgi:hypothetical protein